MIDYHVHSWHSGDAEASISEVCDAAIRNGLTELCFTEHIDFDPTDSCYETFHYTGYCEEIEGARSRYSDRLNILRGVEVDYQQRFHSQIRDFFDGKAFDYVLGAAHYVDGIILEDHERYFPGKSAYDAYAPYFDNVLAAVETGFFDALAHLDLCKRYGVIYFGQFDWKPHVGVIDDILNAVVSRGMTLGINTSGIRQAPLEAYPGKTLVQRYFDLGGRNIIVGSDAHKADDVGAGIYTALQMAIESGFAYVDVYRERHRDQLPIARLTSRGATQPHG